jgi:hypothetical protein
MLILIHQYTHTENEKRLKSLPGELLTYEAQDSIKGRAGSRQRLEALGELGSRFC